MKNLRSSRSFRKGLQLVCSLSLAGSFILSSSRAAADTIDCKNQGSTTAKNKEQRLKTYTPLFWSTLQQHLSIFPEALRRQGVVIGDFHFKNVGVYFDYQSNHAVLTVNDLDDAGIHALIGDLIKYLNYLKSLKKNLDFEKVIAAYETGLRGQKFEIPGEIKLALSQGSDHFEKKRVENILSVDDGSEQVSDDDLSEEQSRTFATLENLSFMKDLETQKKWIQTNSSGSSANMDRYLFLGHSRSTGTLGLLEFKTLTCSATGDSHQQDLIANREMLVAYFQTVGSSAYLRTQKVIFADKKFFLVRSKEPNALNHLHLDQKPTEELQKIAEFMASYLGLLHSKSADAAYTDAITANSGLILSQAKDILLDFNKEAKKDETEKKK